MNSILARPKIRNIYRFVLLQIELLKRYFSSQFRPISRRFRLRARFVPFISTVSLMDFNLIVYVPIPTTCPSFIIYISIRACTLHWARSPFRFALNCIPKWTHRNHHWAVIILPDPTSGISFYWNRLATVRNNPFGVRHDCSRSLLLLFFFLFKLNDGPAWNQYMRWCVAP